MISVTGLSSLDRDARREAERTTRGGSRATRLPSLSSVRRRAPKSASQFRVNIKYSNRSGKHRASKSCLQKLAYDHGLNLRDVETGNLIRHGRRRDDVSYRYGFAQRGSPPMVADLELLGNKCFALTKGKRGDMRQMSHLTISLPSGLDRRHRESLSRSLTRLISQQREGVPVHSAVHLPDNANKNWHLHTSHPINHIVADENAPGGFKLGDRIMAEQQAKAREGAGLAKTNHAEVRELRRLIAHQIADEMDKAGLEHMLCERWRHGYLPLNNGKDTQLTRAIARGDIEFVQENFARSTTFHEGPGAQRTDSPSYAKAHNSTLRQISPELMARMTLQQVVHQAKELGLDDWQQVQLLAQLHGVNINFTRSYSKDSAGNTNYGEIAGVQYTLNGGPKMAGKAADMSLSKLKAALRGLGHPIYKQKISDDVRQVFKERLASRNINPALKEVASTMDDMERAALAQARAAIVKAKAVAAQPLPTPPKEQPMDVRSLIRDVSSLPTEPATAPGVTSTPTPDLTTAKRPLLVTKEMVSALTPDEKEFLREEYDHQIGQFDFTSPCYKLQQKLDSLQNRVTKHYRQEPFPNQERQKRLFRQPRWAETHDHIRWRERRDELVEHLKNALGVADIFFSKVYSNPKIYVSLSDFHAKKLAEIEAQEERDRQKNLVKQTLVKQRQDQERMARQEQIAIAEDNYGQIIKDDSEWHRQLRKRRGMRG